MLLDHNKDKSTVIERRLDANDEVNNCIKLHVGAMETEGVPTYRICNSICELTKHALTMSNISMSLL